jgi:hypothetical protein
MNRFISRFTGHFSDRRNDIVNQSEGIYWSIGFIFKTFEVLSINTVELRNKAFPCFLEPPRHTHQLQVTADAQ